MDGTDGVGGSILCCFRVSMYLNFSLPPTLSLSDVSEAGQDG